MIDELSPNLPKHLTSAIRAGMLEIESKEPDGVEFDSCVKKAYDVFAGALVKDGEIPTDDVLDEVIPGWILRWGRAHRWFGRWLYYQDHESYVRLGEMRVPALVRKQILSPLARRIAYWKAVALNATHEPENLARDTSTRAVVSGAASQVPKQDKETPKQVIDRVRDGWGISIQNFAERVDVSTKTLNRLRGGKDISPRLRIKLAVALHCEQDMLRWKPLKTTKIVRRKKSAK